MNEAVEWAVFVLGFLIAGYTASSLLRTLVVPRGLTSLLASFVNRLTRKSFIFVSNRFDSYESKDRVMAFGGPIFLVVLLIS